MRHRSSFVPAVTLAALACAFAWPRPVISDPPATAPASQPVPAVGPIAYYVANCARCHGDVSAAYVGLPDPKTGKALESAIDQMALGPADAPLDDEGLRQQTALHEAMFRKQPFVWLDPSKPDRLAGETLPGTTLTLAVGGAESPVPVGPNGRFDQPRRPGTLTAACGGTTTKTDVR